MECIICRVISDTIKSKCKYINVVVYFSRKSRKGILYRSSINTALQCVKFQIFLSENEIVAGFPSRVIMKNENVQQGERAHSFKLIHIYSKLSPKAVKLWLHSYLLFSALPIYLPPVGGSPFCWNSKLQLTWISPLSSNIILKHQNAFFFILDLLLSFHIEEEFPWTINF